MSIISLRCGRREIPVPSGNFYSQREKFNRQKSHRDVFSYFSPHRETFSPYPRFNLQGKIKTPAKEDFSPRDNLPKPQKEVRSIKYLRRALYVAALYSAMFHSLIGPKVLNEFGKLVRFTPAGTSSVEIATPGKNFSLEHELDAFFANHMEENLKQITDENNIEVGDYDLNNDKIILNNNEEINSFTCKIAEIIDPLPIDDPKREKLEKFLLDFTDVAILNRLIFDVHPNEIKQNDRLNCFLMSTVVGNIKNKNTLQELKGSIVVSSYNLNPENFEINLKVFLNNKWINVPYRSDENGNIGIVEWMGQEATSTSNNALLVPAITRAFENISDAHTFLGYETWKLPPGYAIVLTGVDHSFYPIRSIPREDLIKALNNVPNINIAIGRYPTCQDLYDFSKSRSEFFKKLFEQEEIKTIEKKAERFEHNTQQYISRLNTEVKTTASPPPVPQVKNTSGLYVSTPVSNEDFTSDLPPGSFLNSFLDRFRLGFNSYQASVVSAAKISSNSAPQKENNLITNHTYTITEFNYNKNKDEFLVTVEDAHGRKVALEEKDFYESMDFIVLRNDISPSSRKDFLMYFMVLFGLKKFVRKDKS